MTEIAIINYGIGNLRSLERTFDRVDIDAVLTDDPVVIAAAPRLLLPGVGHFKACVDSFNASGLRPAVEDHVANKKPILGICVGMQMLFESSGEGEVSGLGWIEGVVSRFSAEHSGKKLKVPHVGMNVVRSNGNPLFYNLPEDPRFYFTHSYRVKDTPAENIAGVCEYGGKFIAAVQKDNIYGTQFHPEKSHKNGAQLLKNFMMRE